MPMQPLGGRTIALPETRELDRLARLLEDEGATALRCPLVAILDAPDPAPVLAWLRTLAGGGFDDVVLLTGEGLRRLVKAAEAEGPALRDAVVAALGRARKITRGPKPARALHELGLASDLPAPVPTSLGVAEALLAAPAGVSLAGRRVGLQLYGAEPNRPLVEAIEGAGAVVTAVAPYVYAPASDQARVAELVDALAAGRVDAIAFTSASQVDRLWEVARAGSAAAPGANGDAGEARLRAGLGRTRVAAIGPIAAESLQARGVRVDVIPEKSFVMKRLVNALVEALRPTS